MRRETVRLRFRAMSTEVGFRRSMNSVFDTLVNAEGRMGVSSSTDLRSCLCALGLGTVTGGESLANDETPGKGG